MAIQELPTETDQTTTLAQRRAFLKLPLAERRKQLAAQADRMAEHYESESETTEREEWQGGDIVES